MNSRLAYLLIVSDVIKLNHVDKEFALATVHYQYYIVSSAYKPDLKKFVQLYHFDIFK